jgi:hypothetical protein
MGCGGGQEWIVCYGTRCRDDRELDVREIICK